MSGVTLAIEDGQTFWVDQDVLVSILESAMTHEYDRLQEMQDYPDIWGDELPEAMDMSRTIDGVADEIVGFLVGRVPE